MNAFAQLSALRESSYQPHPLHTHDRDFRETNCYADLWIELLHGAGLEPRAALAMTLGTEFEGDHWTFFKPSHAELGQLYGLRVDEMTVWRALLEHLQTQLSLSRVPMIEVDSWFLPDTEGSDYHEQHTKTTIAIVGIEAAERRLRYFHNAGFFELSGVDFDGLLRTGELALVEDDDPDPARAAAVPLPPYCEIVKVSGLQERPVQELRQLSRDMARRHIESRSPGNPVARLGQVFDEHVGWIADGGLPTYHAYTFASLRQLGAAHELGAEYLRWLDPECLDLATAAEEFVAISAASKMLVMKLARAASGRRNMDVSERFADMSRAWEHANDLIAKQLR